MSQEPAPDKGVKFIIPQRMITPIELKVSIEENDEEGEYVCVTFVEGIATPGGVAASEAITYKLAKVASDDLALKLTGGIHLAKANEILTP